MACNCEGKTINIGMGCCVPVVANANHYYTKSEVDEKLEDIVASGCCITPEEVDDKISAATSGYATQQWVTDQGYLTEHQQLKTINNESLIGEGNITISSETVDLSNYYNKQEIDAMLDDKATQTWVLNQHYVTNSELIQYITNLQTQINYLQTTISGCCGGDTGETTYRWITMTGENDYECSGTTKYTKEKKQQSTDGGNTWTDVTPAETRRGSTVLEVDSVDCGYVPTNLKFSGVLYNGNTVEVPCNSSSTLTTGETRTTNAYTSVEIGDCVSVIGEGVLKSQVFLRGSLVLPSSIRTIEKDAFTNCGKLSGVTLNDGLETLGEGVFKYCTGLTTVTIPNSVTSIGKQTFYLDRFNTVTIGSGVTSIGLGAFETTTEYAQNREYVKILATTPPTLEDASSGSYTFNGSYPIYVPSASVNAYKTAWRGYASRIQPIQ